MDQTLLVYWGRATPLLTVTCYFLQGVKALHWDVGVRYTVGSGRHGVPHPFPSSSYLTLCLHAQQIPFHLREMKVIIVQTVRLSGHRELIPYSGLLLDNPGQSNLSEPPFLICKIRICILTCRFEMAMPIKHPAWNLIDAQQLINGSQQTSPAIKTFSEQPNIASSPQLHPWCWGSYFGTLWAGLVFYILVESSLSYQHTWFF